MATSSAISEIDNLLAFRFPSLTTRGFQDDLSGPKIFAITASSIVTIAAKRLMRSSSETPLNGVFSLHVVVIVWNIPVGTLVGTLAGVFVGTIIGVFVGVLIGTIIGVFVGALIGAAVGCVNGSELGCKDGAGDKDGLTDMIFTEGVKDGKLSLS